MEVLALLKELDRRSISLRMDGDRLLFRPYSAIPSDLLMELAANKTEIMWLLEYADRAQGGSTKHDGLPTTDEEEPDDWLETLRAVAEVFSVEWFEVPCSDGQVIRVHVQEDPRLHPPTRRCHWCRRTAWRFQESSGMWVCSACRPAPGEHPAGWRGVKAIESDLIPSETGADDGR